MNVVIWLLAVVVLAHWLPSTLEMLLGLSVCPRLRDNAPAPADGWPSVSVLVPACNEAATIEPAMRSLLGLDYPDIQIIAVNDRSADATGGILDRLAVENSRLRVIHLSSLPAGWLGKNHALCQAAAAADGEWLLMTDADVKYRPGALRAAVALACRTRRDHLVVLPEIETRNGWERLFVPYFMAMFNFRFRPWQSWVSWLPGYIGIGAFGLIRTQAYRAIGGHSRLPLEVADDILFGRLVKRAGLRQGVASGGEFLSVRWVAGLNGILSGLEKNGFSGLGYSWPALTLVCLVMLVASVWPVVGALVGTPTTRAICAASWLSMAVAAFAVRDTGRCSPWHGLAWPVAAGVFVTALVRSAWLTTRRGGILWRGTLYTIAEIREARGRFNRHCDELTSPPS